MIAFIGGICFGPNAGFGSQSVRERHDIGLCGPALAAQTV
jgi:hypothetical protein